MFNLAIHLPVTGDDTTISYLPNPNIFDQVIFAVFVYNGGRVGYYQGDKSQLTNDCKVLKPTFFPSVPRLYNIIYKKMKKALDDQTGLKGVLVKWAFNSKI